MTKRKRFIKDLDVCMFDISVVWALFLSCSATAIFIELFCKDFTFGVAVKFFLFNLPSSDQMLNMLVKYEEFEKSVHNVLCIYMNCVVYKFMLDFKSFKDALYLYTKLLVT